ncbi:MAG: EamA family transporter [Candidatus Marinimicrobia bacterium]|nr:EamA family transporter [Candidatus Neomarinimicrobiota bacterium]
MKTKVLAAYLALCIIWGTTWFFIKISLAGTPPFLGASLRFLLAGLILWGIVFWRREYPVWSATAIKVYLAFGVLNLAIGYSLSYWATQFIYSNLSSIIWAAFPLVLTLMAHFYLPEERLNLRKGISILLGMAGVILLMIDSGKLGGENVTAGILTIATAVVIAAWPNIYIKQHRHEIRTIPMNAVSQTLAGVLILIISFIVEKDQQMIMSFVNIGSLLYLVVFGTVIAWLIYIWLFSHISVTLISYIAFFPPIIATVIGWLVLGEKLTPVMLVGAGLVLIGIILIGINTSHDDRNKNFRPR